MTQISYNATPSRCDSFYRSRGGHVLLTLLAIPNLSYGADPVVNLGWLPALAIEWAGRACYSRPDGGLLILWILN